MSKPDERLGRLSDRFESGPGGAETLGWDSAGGLSCGNYQIAVRVGTMGRFLAFCRGRWDKVSDLLAPLLPTVPASREAALGSEFAAAWKRLARAGELDEPEYQFILATHYQPLLKSLPRAGREFILAHPALQEVTYSIAVQHSPRSGRQILSLPWRPGITPEDYIRAVYAKRRGYTGQNTPKVKAAVRSRWKQECEIALKMLEEETAPERIGGEP